MALNIFWFLPTQGESRYLGSSKGARVVDHDYLAQIATAADRLGYGGGYYDRTLAHWQAQGWALPTLIGVAHKEGQVDFAPEAHDIAMNLICAV